MSVEKRGLHNKGLLRETLSMHRNRRNNGNETKKNSKYN